MSIESSADLRASRAGSILPAAPLALLRFELLAIAALCPIFLSVALWNRFPIIFYDTGAYLLEGLGNVFLDERSAVYSLFLRFASATVSLWLVVLIQAAMTAFVMTQVARVEAPKVSLWQLLGIGAVLTFATGLGWYVGQVEPDCMTAVAAFSIYLLAFRAAELGRARCAVLVAVASLAAACHPSHLGLTAGLTLAVIAVRIAETIWRKRANLPRPNLALPLLAFALGLGMVLAANFALTKKVFVSRSGPVFISARMMQDGIVKRLLDDTCPGSHYVLCAYKDKLPTRADAWLWESISPFNSTLGRFVGTEKESNRIVADSLRLYPWTNLRAALYDTALQFVLLKTGDGIEPQEWVLDSEFQHFLPRQLKGYLSARQQRGELHFLPLNIIHISVALASLLGLGLVLRNLVARRQWDKAMFPAFVLLALLGNALICGALSGPHDRYQSRIAWMPTFFLLLTVRPKLELALRRPVESGT